MRDGPRLSGVSEASQPHAPNTWRAVGNYTKLLRLRCSDTNRRARRISASSTLSLCISRPQRRYSANARGSVASRYCGIRLLALYVVFVCWLLVLMPSTNLSRRCLRHRRATSAMISSRVIAVSTVAAPACEVTRRATRSTGDLVSIASRFMGFFCSSSRRRLPRRRIRTPAVGPRPI
jgi:hypothetical protein